MEVSLDIPTDSFMARRLRGALVFLRWPATKPESARVRLLRPGEGDVKGAVSIPVEEGGEMGITGGTGSAAAAVRGKGPMSTHLSTPMGLIRLRQSRSPIIPAMEYQINKHKIRKTKHDVKEKSNLLSREAAGSLEADNAKMALPSNPAGNCVKMPTLTLSSGDMETMS